MESKRYRGYEDETRVSVADMLCSVVGKWRALVIFAAVGLLAGAGLCAVKYRTYAAEMELIRAVEAVPDAVEAAQDAVDAAAEVETELEAANTALSETTAANSFSDDAYTKMEIAYKYRLKYEELKAYADGSLYMQLDADGFYKGQAIYYVYGASNPALVNVMFQQTLRDEGVWDELAEASGLDVEAGYLYEVVGVSSSVSDTYGAVTVTASVNSTTEESCRAMLEVLETKVEEKAESIRAEYGMFSMITAAESVEPVGDDAYISNQNTYTNLLDTYYSKYTSYESGFSSLEQSYYELVYLGVGAEELTEEEITAQAEELIAAAEEAVAVAQTAYDEALSASNAAKEESEAAQAALEEAAAAAGMDVPEISVSTVTSNDEEEEVSVPTNPAMYIIALPVVAIVLWAVWYSFLYLRDPLVRTASESWKPYGLILIGRLDMGDAEPAKTNRIDKAVVKMRTKRKGRADSPEYVAAAVKQLGLEKVVFAGDTGDENVAELLEDIRDKAGVKDVTGWSSVDAEALKKAKKAGYEIIVARTGHTLRKEISRELECCALQGIEATGVICVDGGALHPSKEKRKRTAGVASEKSGSGAGQDRDRAEC